VSEPTDMKTNPVDQACSHDCTSAEHYLIPLTDSSSCYIADQNRAQMLWNGVWRVANWSCDYSNFVSKCETEEYVDIYHHTFIHSSVASITKSTQRWS